MRRSQLPYAFQGICMLPCYHVHVVQVTTIHTSLEPAELTFQTGLQQDLEHKLHETPCLPPLSCQPVTPVMAASFTGLPCHLAHQAFPANI